jgi:putative CocE/NonD family hydrolase
MDFGLDAEIDWLDLSTPWFDYWLKGEQNGVMDGAPVNIFVMGANKWRREETWPPTRAVETDFFLHSGGGANTPTGDGELSIEGPGLESPDSFIYDPRDPVMSLYLVNGQDGPFDQRMNAHRRDILVYQTAPLEQSIEVTGNPVLRLHATSDAVDTDFTVKLIDVHPDGTAINLCYGFQRARFRNGLDERTELMTPGEVYEFDLTLLPTSNMFKVGHQIRIDISSSDYPNHDRNHNTGADDWQDAELRPARTTVFHDTTRPSRITLPVIES